MKTLKRRLVAMKFFNEASRRIVGTSLILLAMVAVLGLLPWRLVAGAEQQQGKPGVQLAPTVSKTLKSAVMSIGSVALAPNGKMLASVDVDTGHVWSVKLWDVATGRNTSTLPNHDDQIDWILSVAFSPDGKTLAMGGFNKITLWDVKTGRNVAMFGGIWQVNSVAFSPDGKTLAAGDGDKTIKLWDMANAKPPATLSGVLVHLVLGTQSVKPTATLSGHQANAFPVVYSPDGKTLASGSEDCTVKLWNVTSGRCTATLTGHNKGIYALAFAPNGRTLASGSLDGTIKLWDIASEKSIATLMGHTGGVWGLGFSPDSKTLVSGSEDKSIRMWDISTRKNIHILNGHTDWVFSAFYSPDGRTLVSGSRDGTVKLWDSGAVNK
jgi:WD40 repeat protein